MHWFASSSIAAASYDSRRRALRLLYVGGGLYDYLQVPKRKFDELLAAPSKGQFVNWQIKPYYSYEVVR